MTVSPEDRAKWERQVEGLKLMENDDEGTAEWREEMFQAENRRRAKLGIAPMKHWWEEDPPEAEFYRRARALGLLD